MGLRIALSFLLLCMPLGFAQTQKWPHHTTLDKDGNCQLYWRPPADKRGDSVIAFRLEVNGKGIAALGFSLDGGLPGGDIVMGSVNDGEVNFQDRHIDSDGMAILDAQQDYKLTSSDENETSTSFEFERNIDTCDKDDLVMHEGTMRVICYYSDEDLTSDDPFGPIEGQSVKSVVLLKGNNDVDLDYSTLSTWDVTSDNLDISTSENLMWCKIVKSPDVSKKNHIVAIEPLIQPGNEEYVFYMILYECFGETGPEYEDLLASSGHACYDPNKPEPMKRCKDFTVMWVSGERGLELPEHVGFPIDPDFSRFYSFEIGYNNPGRASITDNSGFRIYYTENLREHDGGVFLVGVPHSPKVFIPPFQDNYTVVGLSNPQCTSVFPEDGIKVIGITPHSHLVGRGKDVLHFRGNTELPPLVKELNYDIMIQEVRFFDQEVIIYKDDRIAIVCRYNTKQKTKVTYGGQIITDEMCVAIMYYYPLVKGYASLSVPTYATISQALGVDVTNEEQIYDVLSEYDWENADIKAIENAMVYSPQNTQCHFGEFTEQDAENDLVSFPSNYTPYQLELTCPAAP